jgi:hypothetical protein
MGRAINARLTPIRFQSGVNDEADAPASLFGMNMLGIK